MTVRVRVDTIWLGNKLSKQVLDALEEALKDETEEILRVTNNTAVPFADGDLMGSGDTDVDRTSKNVEGSVYYDTPYAARLHEHPEYDFQNGRKGKYLEDVVMDRAEKAQKRLETAMKKALSKKL